MNDGEEPIIITFCICSDFLLQLLLWAQVVCVSALCFTAICCARMQASVAFTANHFIAIILLSQNSQ